MEKEKLIEGKGITVRFTNYTDGKRINPCQGFTWDSTACLRNNRDKNQISADDISGSVQLAESCEEDFVDNGRTFEA